jgi:hypothetical protein
VGLRSPTVSRGGVGGNRTHRRGLSGWLADAVGADGAGLGGLRTLAVGPDEALEVRVVCTLKAQLLAPGGGYDWRGEVGVGADEDVSLAVRQIPQLLYLVLWQVGAVGDPDRPVLEGVDGVLVGDGLVVETAVLPDGVMLPACRRASTMTSTAKPARKAAAIKPTMM